MRNEKQKMANIAQCANNMKLWRKMCALCAKKMERNYTADGNMTMI